MGKEKERKEKPRTSPKTLFGIPIVLFLAMYFLFPVLAESFLKISLETYKSRQEEFRANINANKERLKDMKKEGRESAIKRELTFTYPEEPSTQSENEQDKNVSDMLTPKVPELDIDPSEIMKKLSEFNNKNNE